MLSKHEDSNKIEQNKQGIQVCPQPNIQYSENFFFGLQVVYSDLASEMISCFFGRGPALQGQPSFPRPRWQPFSVTVELTSELLLVVLESDPLQPRRWHNRTEQSINQSKS